MKSYLTKTPRLIQRIYKNYTWRFSMDEKEIYLTFDDGPTPEITNWTLDTLKEFNAKATFFCIGKNVADYPEVYTRILEEKHSVGNHTHNHLKGFKTPIKKYIENVLIAEKELQKSTINNQKLFRPPYGKIRPRQAQKLRSLGYKLIMWDVLSADFDNTLSKEECLKNVLKHTTKGSIIVFHDSKKAEEKLRYTLPKVLEYFSKKGYVFKAIP